MVPTLTGSSAQPPQSFTGFPLHGPWGATGEPLLLDDVLPLLLLLELDDVAPSSPPHAAIAMAPTMPVAPMAPRTNQVERCDIDPPKERTVGLFFA